MCFPRIKDAIKLNRTTRERIKNKNKMGCERKTYSYSEELNDDFDAKSMDEQIEKGNKIVEGWD